MVKIPLDNLKLYQKAINTCRVQHVEADFLLKVSLKILNSGIILKTFTHDCLFAWFDSLRPINNISVIKGRVFLGWTSTKLGLMFLLKDTTQWRRWGSNPRPFSIESSTLPLSHYAPCFTHESWYEKTWEKSAFKNWHFSYDQLKLTDKLLWTRSGGKHHKDI